MFKWVKDYVSSVKEQRHQRKERKRYMGSQLDDLLGNISKFVYMMVAAREKKELGDDPSTYEYALERGDKALHATMQTLAARVLSGENPHYVEYTGERSHIQVLPGYNY